MGKGAPTLPPCLSTHGAPQTSSTQAPMSGLLVPDQSTFIRLRVYGVTSTTLQERMIRQIMAVHGVVSASFDRGLFMLLIYGQTPMEACMLALNRPEVYLRAWGHLRVRALPYTRPQLLPLHAVRYYAEDGTVIPIDKQYQTLSQAGAENVPTETASQLVQSGDKGPASQAGAAPASSGLLSMLFRSFW